MTDNDRPVSVILYVRISEDRAGDELGVDRQLQDARKLAVQRNWNVIAECVDNDISAKGHRVRPEFERVLKLVEDGEATAVISWDMTRFLRSARDRYRMLELGKTKGTILSFVRGSDLDLSTPAGQLSADILGAVALHEIVQKSDRQKRAALQRAEQGRPGVTSRRAFGYEPGGLELREPEAEALRGAYRSVLAGVSVRQAAADLNAAGFSTPQPRRGKHAGEPSPWDGNNLRGTLLNPRNAGLRYYISPELKEKGMLPVNARIAGIMGRGIWPEIVSEETWRAIVDLLMDPSRNNNVTGSVQALLTGVALCGICDSTVHGGKNPQGQRTYRCSGSMGHISRRQEPVDDWVREHVIERLSRPDAVDLLKTDDPNRPDPAALRERAQTIRARLETVALAFADDDDADPAAFATVRKRLRTRLADVEAQQAVAGRVSVLGPMILSADPAAVWSELDNDRRRAIVAGLLTVRVYPAGRGTRTFREETVEITGLQ